MPGEGKFVKIRFSPWKRNLVLPWNCCWWWWWHSRSVSQITVRERERVKWWHGGYYDIRAEQGRDTLTGLSIWYFRSHLPHCDNTRRWLNEIQPSVNIDLIIKPELSELKHIRFSFSKTLQWRISQTQHSARPSEVTVVFFSWLINKYALIRSIIF